MTKITSFNKQNGSLNAVQQRALEVLRADPQLAEMGIKFDYAGGSFGETEFTFKVKASVIPADGISPEAAKWAQMAPFYGLPVDAINKQIVINGRVFNITGLSSGRSKNIVNISRARDGKQFRTDAQTVLRDLERGPR